MSEFQRLVCFKRTLCNRKFLHKKVCSLSTNRFTNKSFPKRWHLPIRSDEKINNSFSARGIFFTFHSRHVSLHHIAMVMGPNFLTRPTGTVGIVCVVQVPHMCDCSLRWLRACGPWGMPNVWSISTEFLSFTWIDQFLEMSGKTTDCIDFKFPTLLRLNHRFNLTSPPGVMRSGGMINGCIFILAISFQNLLKVLQSRFVDVENDNRLLRIGMP